jgi:hypothetical protein
MQDDGNLVLYCGSSSPIWASGTNGRVGKAGAFGGGGFGGPAPAYGGGFGGPAPSYGGAGFGGGFAPMPSFGDTLTVGAKLGNDQYLQSRNGMYYARMQSDGNFVVYRTNNFISSNALWSSSSYGKGAGGPYVLEAQQDNNLVVYDRNHSPVWASDTWQKGAPGVRLTMQDDGNLVLYCGNRSPIWASNTYQG